jgi:transposase
VQKVLESTNLKITSVISNIAGTSGRAILAALLGGEADVAVLAELAKGKLRKKRAQLEQALSGRLEPHHRFLLTELLAQIDGLDETIARFDAEIARRCAADEREAVVELLDTIPGIGRAMAELLVAEIGIDMHKFPTPNHLAAWAGVAPGSNESAGHQRSGRTRKGNAWLKTALVQAAHGAARTKGTALAAKYRRVAARRGARRAIMAVAHRLLLIAYHVIARREPYRELGSDYLERRRSPGTVDRLVQRLRDLGIEVTVTAQAGPASRTDAILATTP